MRFSLSRNLRPVAAWGGILLVGAVAGWFGREACRDRLLGALIDDAKLSSVAFGPEDMRALKGTPADLDSPAYERVRSRLRNLRANSARVRAAYLLRFLPETRTVAYLADSSPLGLNAPLLGPPLPGSAYSPVGESPGLRQTRRTGIASTDGPRRDATGTSAIAYVSVDERPGADASAPIRDLLGLEVDASSWAGELWLAGLRSAFYVWFPLGVLFGMWRLRRRQSEQQEVIRNLSEAMEQSHSALMICDLESRIEYANRGLCQQTGYTRRELLGRSWREFKGAETSGAVLAELVATVRAGRSWEGEWLNQRKDGTVYPVRGVVTPVKHRDGSLACFVAVFDDMSEIKRREAELREARDLAQAGDRAKSQFLATMSHEVRTPLNGIVGFTSLLLDTPLASDQREYVQTIRASGEALIQLTSDILDFARIESGKLKLDAAPCDPRECIEDALDLLATKAADKNLELLHRVAADVPSAVVVDGGRLRQVLTNLVGNAVKFTERGEVMVSLRMLPAASTGLHPDTSAGNSSLTDDATIAAQAADRCILEFTVRDSGIGIRPEQQEKLFKPFSQLDESSTRRYGGTGLGLAICLNLVRLMEGEITCQSAPGAGSTFTFTVQAKIATPEPPDHDLSHARLALVAQPGPLRRELGELIGRWGAPVIEADLPAGLAGQEWDIALVDVSESFARVLAQQATRLPELPPAKTFALVPISLSSELRHALHRHFRLLINKPVHHETLFSTLSGANPRAPAPDSRTATRHGLRVLVVEDNPVNQRLMRRILASLACSFTLVENGRRATEELSHRAENYDLVLLDLHTPDLDGITALRAIRDGKAGPLAQGMWFIALIADAREEQRARARSAGINDYLTKPLRVEELEAAFQRFRERSVTT